MLAFKFLRDGGVGPFSGFQWPLPSAGAPGEWVTAPSEGRLCAAGVHACDASSLADWLSHELWIIELGGEIKASTIKLVAPRGRLLRRVDGWNPAALKEFASACIERARKNGYEALLRAGDEAAANHLAAQVGPESIAKAASSWIESRARHSDNDDRAGAEAALALGYLVDAVTYAPIDAPASMFCAAHSGLTEDGFAAERAWQSKWLCDHLGLLSLIGEHQ